MPTPAIPATDALPGWIIGTAGAVRYRLPTEHAASHIAMTDVYGYLLATVAEDDTISFEFKPVKQADVPAATVKEFTPDQVKWCFEKNTSPVVVGPDLPGVSTMSAVTDDTRAEQPKRLSSCHDQARAGLRMVKALS